MKTHGPARGRKTASGFTMVELIVVMLIIGILAAVAVPQYAKIAERGRAAEAVEVLNSVNSAEGRYLAKYGSYCNFIPTNCPGFDFPAPPNYTFPPMKYFTTPTSMTTSAGTSWSLTLARNDSPPVFGAYTITFAVPPAAAQTSSLSCMDGDGSTSCTSSLLTQFQ